MRENLGASCRLVAEVHPAGERLGLVVWALDPLINVSGAHRTRFHDPPPSSTSCSPPYPVSRCKTTKNPQAIFFGYYL